MTRLKLISWNVNGIRSILKKGFRDFIKRHKPDVLCVQETRTAGEPVALGLDPDYKAYWNHAEKPGYAGTLTLTRRTPIRVTPGLGVRQRDREGRVLTAEYPTFYLVNVYVPNSKRDLSRLGYRTREWDPDFLAYLRKLQKKKPVIFCGDLNVAHTEIDLTYPKANVKNHGFTPEERAGFDRLVKAGFLDTFRVFYPGKEQCYTWWSRLGNCRARNIGWRIDYYCASEALRPRLADAFILREVEGSDHCPVGLVIEA